MSENWLESYIKAGKAVIEAKKLARKLIQPGTTLLSIGEACEDAVYQNGCKLAFPINMSLNEIAAHYSPIIDDTTVVPNKGLLKIDVGAHFNGYIADSAFTVNIDGDSVLQKYVDAAEQGLKAAIEIFTPGTRLYELGEVIAEQILSYGLKPVINLGGHELKQYNLHAGPFIPNFKDKSHSEFIKEGDAYACEPFSTSGIGRVENGNHSYIYRFAKKNTKNVPYELIGYMSKIEQETARLPFSPRILLKNKIVPKLKIKSTIDFFLRKKILHNYPVLVERTKAPVAQHEHTLVIDQKGNTIVTTQE